MSKKKSGSKSKKSSNRSGNSGGSSGSGQSGNSVTTSDSRIGASQGQTSSGSGSGGASSSSAAVPSGSQSYQTSSTSKQRSSSRSQSQGSSGSGSCSCKTGYCSSQASSQSLSTKTSCCSGSKTSCCSDSRPSHASKGSSAGRASGSRNSKASVGSKTQSKTKTNSKTAAVADSQTKAQATAVAGGAGGNKYQGEDSDSMGIFRKDPKMCAVLKKKHYIVQKRIAHGAFGQVYKGAKTDDSGQPLMDQLIAIKVVEMSRLQPVFREKYLPQELAALTHVKHDYIVRVHDIFRANEQLFIFMEFAPNGDLSGWLKKTGPMKERLAAFWFGQVVKALTYVHATLRMAHRDIKLDNILLDANYDAKLSDFGFAKECWDSKRHCVTLSQTICGTQPYFAPQLVDRVPYNAYLADVWSMGVMLYVMLNYRFPFHYDQDPTVWLVEMTNWPAFLKTRFLPTVSTKGVELVVALLNPDEKSRMTLHEALKHDWLAKITDKKAPINA